MIYLASPYSDPDPIVRADRYERVCKVAAELLKKGIPVYSPIVHSHVLAEKYGMPYDGGFWSFNDRAFIKRSSLFFLLQLPGWEASVGISNEMKFASERSIRIYKINEDLNDPTSAAAIKVAQLHSK